MDVVWK
jgi:hypothetical protein